LEVTICDFQFCKNGDAKKAIFDALKHLFNHSAGERKTIGFRGAGNEDDSK
jgi:hypothetical protein